MEYKGLPAHDSPLEGDHDEAPPKLGLAVSEAQPKKISSPRGKYNGNEIKIPLIPQSDFFFLNLTASSAVRFLRLHSFCINYRHINNRTNLFKESPLSCHQRG